jgi:hypothetical protein
MTTDAIDSNDERIEDIQYWWEGANSTVELSPQECLKLRQAFFQVLTLLPEEDFDKFLRERPIIICTAFPGRVFSYTVPDYKSFLKSRSSVRAHGVLNRLLRVNGIYLEPKITRRKNLVHMVAHEIAHIVRGDHRNIDPKAEERADDLVEKWGFKRNYSKRMLGRLEQARRRS